MSLWKLLPYKAAWPTFPQANLHSCVSKCFPGESRGTTQCCWHQESWGRSSGRSSLFGDSSISPLLSYGVGMIWVWTGLQSYLAMLVPVYSASLLPPPPGFAQEPCASAAPVSLQWDNQTWTEDLPCPKAPGNLKTAAWPPLLYSIFIACNLKTKYPVRSHWNWKVCISCRTSTCKRIFFRIFFPLALWLGARSTTINLWHCLESQLTDKVLLCY